jgi:hypothetical protein
LILFIWNRSPASVAALAVPVLLDATGVIKLEQAVAAPVLMTVAWRRPFRFGRRSRPRTAR